MSNNNFFVLKPMSKIESMSSNELVDLKNKIDALLETREMETKNKYLPNLISEIMNLMDGAGKGYCDGDYYAPSRFYSSIPGIKNIRFGYLKHIGDTELKKSYFEENDFEYNEDGTRGHGFAKVDYSDNSPLVSRDEFRWSILVKITSEFGKRFINSLPDIITVRGEEFAIGYCCSENYDSTY